MPGQPFRSRLKPFAEHITKARLEMKTWHEIAEHITAQGTKTDASQVARFAKRHANAKVPFGFPPQPGEAFTAAGELATVPRS